MVHGYPDWGVTAGKKTTYQLKDIAELAVRLGSIVNFDRLGDVILLDDFEASVLKWDTGGTGTGNAAALSTADAKSGSQSAKLTTGNAENDTAKIRKYIPLPVTSKVGVELALSLGSDIKSFDIGVWFYNGSFRYSTGFTFYPQSNLIYEPHASFTLSSDTIYDGTAFYYHDFKFVLDLETEEYVRARWNDRQYDISDYDISKSADNSTPVVLVVLEGTNNAAGNHYVYVDDVIFTQNEP